MTPEERERKRWVYEQPDCRIERSADGGYLVWTRIHEHAAWQAAPIPKGAVGALMTDQIERDLGAKP